MTQHDPTTDHVVVNSDDLPWAPVPGTPGQSFKLLHADLETGDMTALLKLEPGTVTPVHEHFGTTELFTISGHWGDDDLPGGFRPGGYLFEGAGYRHQEAPPTEEIILLARSSGDTQSFDADGNPFPEIGARMMLKVWQRHVAEHTRA